MSKQAKAISPKKWLANTLYPVSFPMVDRVNRVPTFVKYLAAHRDAPVFDTRLGLYGHVAQILGSAPLDYLEFGVHKGESILQWSQLNQHPESRFFGFDSFEGLPEKWWGLGRGHFSTSGQLPETSDARIRFIKGWFQDTLDGFLRDFTPHNRLVINNDSDLYSSTLYTLTKLDPLLAPGTIIFFDEFDDVQHEFRAMEDYSAAYRKKFRVIAGNDRFRTAALEVL